MKLDLNEVENLELESLPTTIQGLRIRAKKENWPYEEIRGRGGKNGVKKVYELPDYVVAEIENRILTKPSLETQPSRYTILEPKASYTVDKINDLVLHDRQKKYQIWIDGLDLSSFVPIAHYPTISASAGNGAINYENYECRPLLFDYCFIYHELRRKPENLICIPIVGDSMEPTIRSGGMAMIDISIQYEGEGIYLIRQGEALKIKRLQQVTHDKMLIISDNTMYTSIEIDFSQVDEYEFSILGKYLWDSGIAK